MLDFYKRYLLTLFPLPMASTFGPPPPSSHSKEESEEFLHWFEVDKLEYLLNQSKRYVKNSGKTDRRSTLDALEHSVKQMLADIQELKTRKFFPFTPQNQLLVWKHLEEKHAKKTGEKPEATSNSTRRG